MKPDFKYTQAIIVRKDIEIPKGKLAVQVAHASVGAYLQVDNMKLDEDCLTNIEKIIELQDNWFNEGQRKIVFKVNNVDELYTIEALARELYIPSYLVEDMACTVFDYPTVTCIGLGPVSIEKMNEITKDLKLY